MKIILKKLLKTNNDGNAYKGNMKYKKIVRICAVTALCLSFQAHPLFAQNIIEENLPETIAAEEEQLSQTLSELPFETEPSTQPSETTEETEEQTEEETEEQTQPVEVSGLHTTCESDKKVLLEWTGSDDVVSYRVYRKTGDGDYSFLGDTQDVFYRDTSVIYGKTYDYKIVPVSQDGTEGAFATIRLRHAQAVNIKTQKYTYKQMQTDMKELVLQYSDYCTLNPIGLSVEGRSIYDFVIGNPKAGNSLLVVSTLHAREYICSAVLMREIEYYLRNYNSPIDGTIPAELFNNIQIHYVVMANPDGVTISQTKKARWKANSRGVDLNRNFPAKKFVVVGKKGSEGYSGKKALSEPETKAITALTQNLKNDQNLLGVINYHAMGQIVFGDCSNKNIKIETQTMYKIARDLTGYKDAGGYSSGKSSGGGSYREYVMDMLKIPSITLEVGRTIAPCSYSEYNSAFNKNKLVVLKIADAL